MVNVYELEVVHLLRAIYVRGEIPLLYETIDKNASRRVEGLPESQYVKQISCGQNSAAAVLSDGQVIIVIYDF